MPPSDRLSPLDFFRVLHWIDGTPLLDSIEAYRRRIFTEALSTLGETGVPLFNLVLAGRAKKNWKSADLILAALYRLCAWSSSQGNECYVVATDEAQADNDLALCKKIIRATPSLARALRVKKNVIERRDDQGFLQILPGRDVLGQHGTSYLFLGIDELHTQRSYDLLEGLQLDPHRPDALMWITSYASLWWTPGTPLYDLVQKGKAGTDPRMYFSWYAGDYCTDPGYAARETPEERANPSTLPPGYLDQQRSRLPLHRYRRLHLNLPGAPEGAYYSPQRIEEAVVAQSRRLAPPPGVFLRAFVDMSGGSEDDATLSLAYHDGERVVVCGVWTQGSPPPFDPRKAVALFASILRGYGVSHVVGDKYGGETFIADFAEHGIAYDVCPLPKSALYEALEVELNSGRVSLPDDPALSQQLLTLVMRGGKIDHVAGEHDDVANAAAGVVWLAHDGAASGPGEVHVGGPRETSALVHAGVCGWEAAPDPPAVSSTRGRGREVDW